LGEIVNAAELHGGFVILTFVITTGTGGDFHKNVPIALRQGPHVF
jgi:hypothetical protein